MASRVVASIIKDEDGPKGKIVFITQNHLFVCKDTLPKVFSIKMVAKIKH